MEENLSWDVWIDTDDEGFTLLEEGDYDFTVNEINKRVSSNQRNMLEVTLTVTDGEASTTVKDYLVITQKALWKVASFLRAIGLKKHGQGVSLSVIDKALGKTGRCHLIVDEYTNNDGKTYKNNKIGSYYDLVENSKAQKAQDNKLPW